MDLIQGGDVAGAIIAFQSRVSNRLNAPAAHERVMDCVEFGVQYGSIETLLCYTLARYELIPRQIAIMSSARPLKARSLREAVRIKSVLEATRRNAGQVRIFGFERPIPNEALIAICVVIGHFENEPGAERKLRAKLGVPLKRLEALQAVARRSAIGFFSAEMRARFRDGKPHDELVAALVNAALPVSVDYHDVEHYRAAYLRLQAFA